MDRAEQQQQQHGASPVIQRSEAKSREATEIDVVTAAPDEQLIARVGGGVAALLAWAALAVTVSLSKHTGYLQTGASFGSVRP